MDDNEVDLIREGWQEKGADWFGKVELGSAGKIAIGTLAAGVGMYVGGKSIEPKRLAPPAAEQKAEQPESAARAGVGGGGG